jgi:hypothetical protein
MTEDDLIISQTKAWIREVVIGCNFCPFAAREIARGTVDYKVVQQATQKGAVDTLIKMCRDLDRNEDIETTLLILPHAFIYFSTFLQLLKAAQRSLEKKGYEGIYQIASFHPDYLFSDATDDDPANYTNRSPYPILQLLREKSVSEAVKGYPDPEGIPKRNVTFAREKGLLHMQALLAHCITVP